MFGAETTWPEAVIFLGVLLATLFLIGVAVSGFLEFRKTKLLAAREDNLRQLVTRYEQLAGDHPRRPAAGGRRRVRAAVTDDLNRADPADSGAVAWSGQGSGSRVGPWSQHHHGDPPVPDAPLVGGPPWIDRQCPPP